MRFNGSVTNCHEDGKGASMIFGKSKIHWRVINAVPRIAATVMPAKESIGRFSSTGPSHDPEPTRWELLLQHLSHRRLDRPLFGRPAA